MIRHAEETDTSGHTPRHVRSYADRCGCGGCTTFAQRVYFCQGRGWRSRSWSVSLTVRVLRIRTAGP